MHCTARIAESAEDWNRMKCPPVSWQENGQAAEAGQISHVQLTARRFPTKDVKISKSHARSESRFPICLSLRASGELVPT